MTGYDVRMFNYTTRLNQAHRNSIEVTKGRREKKAVQPINEPTSKIPAPETTALLDELVFFKTKGSKCHNCNKSTIVPIANSLVDKASAYSKSNKCTKCTKTNLEYWQGHDDKDWIGDTLFFDSVSKNEIRLELADFFFI